MIIKKKVELGASAYVENVVSTTPIGRGLQRMCLQGDDLDSLRMKFNSCYYLAKRERPFADYPHLLELQKKNDVKQIRKSYATERAAGIFTNYIGQVYKFTRRSGKS